jgi:hypothetical protein
LTGAARGANLHTEGAASVVSLARAVLGVFLAEESSAALLVGLTVHNIADYPPIVKGIVYGTPAD